MARSRNTIRIAFAAPFGVPHYDRTMRGILRFASERSHWSIAVTPDFPGMSFSDLCGWSGDGAIAVVETPREARLAAKQRFPVVNVSGTLAHTSIPRVTVDNRAIGRMAAQHLLDCGFRRFAYYGVEGLWYSEQRGIGFEETIAEAGGTFSRFLSPRPRRARATWGEVNPPLCKWLESLDSPAAIFACHDYRARLILDACAQCGLCVPDELALLGVNNDAIACEFCWPPLSSVSRGAEEVGYQAASLLDRLIAGEEPPKADILVPPDGVVRRRSTDVMAIDDPELQAAVRIMHERLSEPLTIAQLAHERGVSRRWLEHAFRDKLGKSPHEYLNFLRIRHAKDVFLREPNPRILDVARECGFSDAKRFRCAFIRIVGISPNQYRKQPS